MNVIAIVISGAIGTLLRFLVYGMVAPLGVTAFPVGTFLVNVLGCLILGVVVGWNEMTMDPRLKVALMVGFCGALTTFSTFILEIVNLMKVGEGLKVALYIGLSILVGLIIFRLGFSLAEKYSV